MSKRTFIINAFDLLVLCCLAIAQPVFDLLGKNAEFLAARNSDAIDVIVLTIAFTLFFPALLIAVEFIAWRVGDRTYDITHRVVTSLLVALFFLSPMKPLYQSVGIWWILISVALAGVVSETYIRLRPKGLALAYLSPVAVILPGLFIFHSPVHAIVLSGHRPAAAYPRVSATAPVVMVVFDEFPLASLMDEHDGINSLLYPNIAKFAGTATWYRNASSVGAGTLHAVPAILDGLLPDPDRQLLPFARDHPHTLFTLLGGTYRMNVVENNTRLCPEDLCGPAAVGSSRARELYSLFSDIGVLYLYILLPPGLTHSLPNITLSWKEFAVAQARMHPRAQKPEDFDLMTTWEERPRVFARFVESIRQDSRPVVNFIHILLPHAPWEYLPSGVRYALPENDIRGLVGLNDRGLDAYEWLNDPWAIQQAYQRHLLQVGMVDRLIGNLIDHLKDVNLFAPSLIVITADHGTSFRPHASRRAPSSSNYADIMAIPLFIKAPNQERGEVNDSNVETIDILPTVADILGVKLPWATDGRSVLNSSAGTRTTKTIVIENGKKLEFDARLPGLYESIREKSAIFGSTPDDLFRIGPYKELIGQNIGSLNVTRSSVKCILDGGIYLENVDLNSEFVLTNISGHLALTPQPLAAPLDLAIAINDKIGGVTETYSEGKGIVRFSSVLSDRDFRPGYNKVRVYLVSRTGSRYELAETEGAEIPRYHWGEVLLFGANNNARSFEAGGWSTPEEKITWTHGKQAELVLPTPASKKAIRLRFYAGVYLKPGKLDRQSVTISVNGRAVMDWVLTRSDFEVRQVIIPSSLLDNSDRIVLTFSMPDSTCPNAIGDGNDIRQLGLAFSWLSLTEAQ